MLLNIKITFSSSIILYWLKGGDALCVRR